MQKKVFNQGDIIFRQNDPGRSFFQLESGKVKVVVQQEGEETCLTELKAGDYFGEMAVLEGYPRSATVIALEDGTEVLEIGRNELGEYFDGQPDKIYELFCHIGNRLRALTDDYKEASAVYEEMCVNDGKPKSEGLGKRIDKVLSRFFGNKKDTISAETRLAMEQADFTKGYSNETVAYKANTVIFKEGEPSRCMYAIHWGTVGIYSGYGTPDQKLLADLSGGKFFGEMGMIEEKPRSATAVALENNTTLEIIGKEDLKELFTKNPPKLELILQNLSYRLRRLTIEYEALCEKISEKQRA